MSARQQEALLRAAALHSPGAPFLFHPDTDRDGGSVGEPVDLAWVCRGTVFLMTMQSGEESCARQVSRNLSQLQGQLQSWSAGRPLVGRNDWGDFEIGWDEVDWVVLISVVAGADSTAEFLQNSTDDLAMRFPKVAAVVSAPEAVITDLLEWGGTALDLADYLLRLAALPPIPEGLARAVLGEQYRSAVTNVRTDRADAFEANFTPGLVSGLRSMSKAAVAGPGGYSIGGSAAIFNDLDWAENARVILTITDVTTLVREALSGADGLAGVDVALSFDTYLFLIMAADHPDHLDRATARYSAEHPAAQPVLITNLVTGRAAAQTYSPVIVFPQTLPPPAVGRLLAGPMIEARRSAASGGTA